MIKIIIARHGETTWNAEMRLQGRSDPGLSPKGYAQRLALLEQIKDLPISAIYTSTLQRSILTAEPIATHFGLSIQKRPELDEMYFGNWEGRSIADFDGAGKEEWKRFRENRLTFREHGGENYTDVANRLKPFVERILQIHRGQEILIVGHRAANRMLIGILLECSLEKALRIEQSNDCIYAIERNGEAKVFHYLNGEIKEGLLLEVHEIRL